MRVSIVNYLIKAVLLCSLSLSCIENNTTNNTRQSQGAIPEEDFQNNYQDPQFVNDLNYFQNGNSIFEGVFSMSYNFKDTFYLKGKGIHFLIKGITQFTSQCLVAYFPSSSGNTTLVMAAVVRTRDTSNGEREYYFLVSPYDESYNRGVCQRANLSNALEKKYSTTTISYSLKALCPRCTTGITSREIFLYGQSGIKVDSLRLKNLSLNLISRPEISTSIRMCNSSAYCKSIGFECCSQGQCANDGSVKDNIDRESQAFIQAVEDIRDNPQRIINYPQFFHVCPKVEKFPEDAEDEDLEGKIEDRFLRLNDLYNCLNPQEGEMSICTKVYKKAKIAVNKIYTTDADDRNFNSTYSGTANILGHSIVDVFYGDKNLIETDNASIGEGNDNLTDTQSIIFKFNSGDNDLKDLRIRYKIDGSCRKISTFRARCKKYYIQGQNKSKVTDHFPASNHFLLPYYVDLNSNIKVEVDEAVYYRNSDWELVVGPPSMIKFLGNKLRVNDHQKVIISFSVDTSVHQNILNIKQSALEDVKKICNCNHTDCNLTPVIKNDNIIDYHCHYPQPINAPPPNQQTIYVSAKSVPHRFFDENGNVVLEENYKKSTQEGILFEYTNNDLLRPNNIDKYVGFNEIYGSFTTNVNSAKPAKEVRVEKGKVYDIIVTRGSYSSCLICGTDYYSQLARIFPSNIINKGGGYVPDSTTTSRFSTDVYRADDLLFGRACFVPATMIPWTHFPLSNLKNQRLRRLKAQHFLFSNGYHRDWYGFDYGALIGSFDGVAWFSIGNQRRITAQSNKLFIAINSYLGDLTVEDNYTVVLSSISSGAHNTVTSIDDHNNDGAQCRKYYQCRTDLDCARQIGWEYACENIGQLKTNWPVFDSNGLEIANSSKNLSLVSLFKVRDGGSKRCVYRGKGAICTPNYNSIDIDSTYAGSSRVGLHACNSAYFCQSFFDGILRKAFNNKISRYGKSITQQNASPIVSESDADTFGKSARVIGRSLNYHGREEIELETQGNLSFNKVSAICLPGRNLTDGDIGESHSLNPSIAYSGDRVTGIGLAINEDNNTKMLGMCSIFDSAGNYYYKDLNNYTKDLDDSALSRLAGSQSISSNSLLLLESLTGFDLIKVFGIDQTNTPILERSRCLRAPGSACFSDLDCAPSNFISNKALGIDNNSDLLNIYEIKYWKEKLICSRNLLEEEQKDDPLDDLRKNRCCRETGNNLSIGTLIDQSILNAGDVNNQLPFFDNVHVPGLGNIALSSAERYSRVATVYDLMSDSNLYPPLQITANNTCSLAPGGCANASLLDNQYNTFSAVAERTCCSGHWIRNFHKEDNGGGHIWNPRKLQAFPKSAFRCLNWIPCSGNTCGNTAFTCDHTDEPDDPNCFARSISDTEARGILEWVSTMELLGIPQIKIKTSDWNDILCKVGPEDQTIVANQSPNRTVPPGLIAQSSTDAEYTQGTLKYFSAIDMDNFGDDLRRVFSFDEITCCYPLGSKPPKGSDKSMCCSGLINAENDLCQLPDYANVSLFFNRYISSSAKDLNANLFDENGFISSPSAVESLACQLNACASGRMARGIALSELRVPGHINSTKTTRRFIDGDTDYNNFNGLADLFNEGLRWNNHVYCIPSGEGGLDLSSVVECDEEN